MKMLALNQPFKWPFFILGTHSWGSRGSLVTHFWWYNCTVLVPKREKVKLRKHRKKIFLILKLQDYVTLWSLEPKSWRRLDILRGRGKEESISDMCDVHFVEHFIFIPIEFHFVRFSLMLRSVKHFVCLESAVQCVNYLFQFRAIFKFDYHDTCTLSQDTDKNGRQEAQIQIPKELHQDLFLHWLWNINGLLTIHPTDSTYGVHLNWWAPLLQVWPQQQIKPVSKDQSTKGAKAKL